MCETPKINQPDQTKCGYVAFSGRGQRAEVWADSAYRACELAVAYFRTPKSKRHLVSVVLAERPGGEQVVHTPDF